MCLKMTVDAVVISMSHTGVQHIAIVVQGVVKYVRGKAERCQDGNREKCTAVHNIHQDT